MLCITNNSIKHQSSVYTQLTDQTVLFKQFSRSHLFIYSLNVKQFYSTHREDPFRCYLSSSEWTWEQWQWRGTLYSPKPQGWWLTFRWFNVISWTLVMLGVLTLCRNAVSVFYSPSRLGGSKERWESSYFSQGY